MVNKHFTILLTLSLLPLSIQQPTIMKKLVTLCFLICSVLVVYPQNFGNFSGAMTGTSITAAAASAAKQ